MRRATLVATSLLKLGVFGAGAYLSVRGVSGFAEGQASQFLLFSVGAIFGAVVLVWHTRSLRELISPRSLVFLASSTLIWRLIWKLVVKGGGYHLESEVALGTTLLTIAHTWLLGAPLRRVLIAIPCILGIWYLSAWPLSHVFPGGYVFNHGFPGGYTYGVWIPDLRAILYTIPMWQAAYLLCMFGSIPQFVRTRFLLSRKT